MNRIPFRLTEVVRPVRLAFRNWQHHRAPRIGAALAYCISLCFDRSVPAASAVVGELSDSMETIRAVPAGTSPNAFRNPFRQIREGIVSFVLVLASALLLVVSPLVNAWIFGAWHRVVCFTHPGETGIADTYGAHGSLAVVLVWARVRLRVFFRAPIALALTPTASVPCAPKNGQPRALIQPETKE